MKEKEVFMKKIIYGVLLGLLTNQTYAANCNCPSGYIMDESKTSCMLRMLIEREATCLQGRILIDNKAGFEDSCTGSLSTTIPEGIPVNEVRFLPNWFLSKRKGVDLWRKRELKIVGCATGE